eukprot:2041221-Rhodomonas_salina.4
MSRDLTRDLSSQRGRACRWVLGSTACRCEIKPLSFISVQFGARSNPTPGAPHKFAYGTTVAYGKFGTDVADGTTAAYGRHGAGRYGGKAPGTTAAIGLRAPYALPTQSLVLTWAMLLPGTEPAQPSRVSYRPTLSPYAVAMRALRDVRY